MQKRPDTGLDQFYTKPDIAESYIRQLSDRFADSRTLFVEPSAGYGAFVNPLVSLGRKVKAMDIEPRGDEIIRGDFLSSHDIFCGNHSNIVVVGNPPFGKNASLAVRFFNHAAKRADAIAFIVPRTFRKMSLQKRLHPNFHLSADRDVESLAFILDDAPHDVPCAWQIWERQAQERPMPIPPIVDHLIEYTTPRRADFAIRRVGYYAGRVISEKLGTLSATTHYFIREVKAGVAGNLKKVDWVSIAAQTAGVRSLSKSEIAFKLGEIYVD